MSRGAIALTLVAAVVAIVASAASSPVADAGSGRRIVLVERGTLAGRLPARVPARAAVTWCGAGQPAAVDRKPDVDLSSSRQVHVTYVVPADGLDQLPAKAGPIATDAEAVDIWWRSQDGGRAPRFDLFGFPGCSSRFGRLDIGFVRLPRVGSLYTGEAGLNRMLSDLGPLASLSSFKHLVYYDGPSPFDEAVCGATTVSPANPTQGGFAGIAFVFLRAPCTVDLGSGGITAETAAHELVHGLGSFIQGGVNECDPPHDGHACDSPSDLMYPFVSPLTAAILDVNRDDYYGHSQAWFDVQDSGWLSRLPQLALSVSSGGGAGTVRLTAPAAFDCGRSCTLTLDQGTQVALAAAPGPGNRFAGWSGACSGTGACTVTLTGAVTVTARFAKNTSRLLVRVRGKGRVASSPGGISCPTRCTGEFTTGVTVKLRPRAGKGYRFAGWTGACRGTGACFLPVDRNRSVQATFRKRS